MKAEGAVATFAQPIAVERLGRIVDQLGEVIGLDARVGFNEELKTSNYDDPFLAQAS